MLRYPRNRSDSIALLCCVGMYIIGVIMGLGVDVQQDCPKCICEEVEP